MKIRELLHRWSRHHQAQCQAERLAEAIAKTAVVICNYQGCGERCESYLALHRHQRDAHK